MARRGSKIPKVSPTFFKRFSKGFCLSKEGSATRSTTGRSPNSLHQQNWQKTNSNKPPALAHRLCETIWLSTRARKQQRYKDPPRLVRSSAGGGTPIPRLHYGTFMIWGERLSLHPDLRLPSQRENPLLPRSRQTSWIRWPGSLRRMGDLPRHARNCWVRLRPNFPKS